MTRALTVAAALLLVALAGCGSGDDETPPTTAPATTATVDQGKEACRGIAQLGKDADFDPTKYEGYGEMAAKSATPAISIAGETLLREAKEARLLEGTRRNLALAYAALDFSTACGQVYGDGPW